MSHVYGSLLCEQAYTSDNSDRGVDTVNEDDEDGDDGCGFIGSHVTGCRSSMMALYTRHKSHFKVGLLVFLALLYFAYFGYAMYYNFGDEPSARLLWVTCLTVAIFTMSLMFRLLHAKFESISSSKSVAYIRHHQRHINWFVIRVYATFAKSPSRLLSRGAGQGHSIDE